ncbi:hypothetical protein OH76DRAFT_599170 [Lentinus brumalis]|uniref:Uncharacterized protein n=1 Tax=Lentinus brumalis TaxID=2498619 RepID=A0A371DUB0_9APHY|nr:hypothetical protein OH76DRAFT_599170 [Polyporus brumalis]
MPVKGAWGSKSGTSPPRTLADVTDRNNLRLLTRADAAMRRSCEEVGGCHQAAANSQQMSNGEHSILWKVILTDSSARQSQAELRGVVCPAVGLAVRARSGRCRTWAWKMRQDTDGTTASLHSFCGFAGCGSGASAVPARAVNRERQQVRP